MAKSHRHQRVSKSRKELKEIDRPEVAEVPVSITAGAGLPDSEIQPFGVVDGSTQTYFKTIEQKLDSADWETEEGDSNSVLIANMEKQRADIITDMQIFLDNVYEEVQGQELALAADHECSVVLEKLLRVSSDLHIRAFFNKVDGNYVNLFQHYCASHVCQTLLILSMNVVDREMRGQTMIANSEETSDLLSMQGLFIDMCKQLTTFWNSLMIDRHATYLVRVILNILGGKSLDDIDETIRSKKSQKWGESRNNIRKRKIPDHNTTSTTGECKVPPMYTTMLKSVVTEIMDNLQDVHLRSYAFNKVANPVLQQLLDMSMYNARDREALISRYLMQNEEESMVDTDRRTKYINSIIKDAVASRLFQKILKYASSSQKRALYTVHFQGNIASLSYHPIANFIVQSLLTYASNKKELQPLLDELCPELGKLLFQSKAFVVQRALEACATLNVCHEQCLTALYTALDIETPEQKKQLFPCLVHLCPVSKLSNVTQCNVAGSAIAQIIVRFPEEHNRDLAHSMSELDVTECKTYLKTPIVSYAFDAFFQSKTVSLSAKHQLLLTLLPILADLAVDKFGCHTVDNLWDVADVVTKEKIAIELLRFGNRLQNNMYGSIIWRNCELETFKRKKGIWREKLEGVNKKKEMFKDILDEPQTTKMANGKKAIIQSKNTTTSTHDNTIDVLFARADSVRPKSVDNSESKNSSGSTLATRPTQISIDANLSGVLEAIENSTKRSGAHNRDRKDKTKKRKTKA